MTEKKAIVEPVYLPSNEPYLGREPVLNFDRVIISCLEVNKEISRCTHSIKLSNLQEAGCQVIPQGINLALTIRECVRQGYLFGALVLLRPLIERAGAVSYLYKYPDNVKKWQEGWGRGRGPSLAKMLEAMTDKKIDIETAKQICEPFHQVTHGDSQCSRWNLARFGEVGSGYSVGKSVDNPELCDFVCVQAYCYLIVLMGMMVAYFPVVAKEARIPSVVEDLRVG